VKQNQVGISFDRDGTSKTENNLLRRLETLGPIPRSVDVIRETTESGVRAFITKNQTGISCGFLTEDDLSATHKHLADLLKKRPTHVDAIYYCLHHPKYAKPLYNVACRCRKPDIGMLTKAGAEFNVDLQKCFVVEDPCVDTKRVKKAGCSTFLVLTRYGVTERNECIADKDVDYVVNNPHEA
jgi:histidinol-phosphate phosphatase family protein